MELDFQNDYTIIQGRRCGTEESIIRDPLLDFSNEFGFEKPLCLAVLKKYFNLFTSLMQAKFEAFNKVITIVFSSLSTSLRSSALMTWKPK